MNAHGDVLFGQGDVPNRVVDLLDDFDTFVNKFTILADNHMATFPGLQAGFSPSIFKAIFSLSGSGSGL